MRWLNFWNSRPFAGFLSPDRQSCREANTNRPQEAAIRAACANLYGKLAQLVSTPGEGAAYVDRMLVSKHLERIPRHAVCLADQAADAAPSGTAG